MDDGRISLTYDELNQIIDRAHDDGFDIGYHEAWNEAIRGETPPEWAATDATT